MGLNECQKIMLENFKERIWCLIVEHGKNKDDVLDQLNQWLRDFEGIPRIKYHNFRSMLNSWTIDDPESWPIQKRKSTRHTFCGVRHEFPNCNGPLPPDDSVRNKQPGELGEDPMLGLDLPSNNCAGSNGFQSFDNAQVYALHGQPSYHEAYATGGARHMELRYPYPDHQDSNRAPPKLTNGCSASPVFQQPIESNIFYPEPPIFPLDTRPPGSDRNAGLVVIPAHDSTDSSMGWSAGTFPNQSLTSISGRNNPHAAPPYVPYNNDESMWYTALA